MERDRIRLEIRTLIGEEFLSMQPRDLDRLSDEITTTVMVAAEPGEVRVVESIEALGDGYACNFQRRTMTAYPQFPRAAFFNTEPARAMIPAPVAAALAALAA